LRKTLSSCPAKAGHPVDTAPSDKTTTSSVDWIARLPLSLKLRRPCIEPVEAVAKMGR
jgi:hypothetical protein